jgi:GH15 family glucan-1,4-alpha-glucosidase
VKGVERLGLEGPADRWRAVREEIRAEVLAEGYSADVQSFVQYYGATHPDGALLMLPLVGFLGADDPRMLGTVRAIRKELEVEGFILRYPTMRHIDGLPPGEGVFLPCTFWLADNLAMQGRHEEARAIFERLLAIRNDVGLLAEEYEPATGRLLGNFPQAFTHVGLINTALNLSRAAARPAEDRSAA